MVSFCPHKSYPGFQAVVKITCFPGRREKDGVEKKQHPQYPRKSYGSRTTDIKIQIKTLKTGYNRSRDVVFRHGNFDQ